MRWVSFPKLARWLLALFFRRIEVEGVENVPTEGGGLMVAWHPNGLIDPGLIVSTFPRRVVFGARHGLFKWPGLGSLMRRLGTVPLYRSKDLRPGDDPEAFKAANDQLPEILAFARNHLHLTQGKLWHDYEKRHDEPGVSQMRRNDFCQESFPDRSMGHGQADSFKNDRDK